MQNFMNEATTRSSESVFNPVETFRTLIEFASVKVMYMKSEQCNAAQQKQKSANPYNSSAPATPSASGAVGINS
jgi:hypothetical protein